MRTMIASLLPLATALLFAGCTADEPEIDDTGVVGDVAATPATAAYGYETWDADRDRRLTATEFAGVSRDRAYSRWNTTADGGLDQNELGTGLYGLWDADDNNQLTESEWSTGTARWNRSGVTYGEFGTWDANSDGWLDQSEMTGGLERAGFYSTWDTDRNDLVDESEFGGGLFDTWDANDDQAVDANEWDLGAGGVDWF